MKSTTPPDAAELMAPEDFDELDAILDELRTRDEEIPQWEFCEGFLAALVCCRRAIPPAEWLPVLLGTSEGALAPFADAAQRARFLALWARRWQEVVSALDAEVENLEDEAAYQPEVMDVRGAMAALPAAERAALGDEPLPAFAQVWALGFMFAVENWPEEWAPPRDKEAAEWLDSALEAMVAMTEDDTGTPEIAPFGDDTPALGQRGATQRFRRRDLGRLRPARTLAQHRSARGDRAQGSHARTQRSLLLRQRQEIQEVPRRDVKRRLSSGHEVPCAPHAAARGTSRRVSSTFTLSLMTRQTSSA